MITKKIGFLGCGNMGGAILKGIVECGVVAKENIYVSDKSKKLLDEMLAFGVNVCSDNKSLCDFADIIILAVKPQYMKGAIDETEGMLEGKCVISIAAGLTVERLKNMIGVPVRLLRVMPNTPAMVLEGVFALCTGSDLTEEETSAAEELFKPLGVVEWIPEHLIDVASGVMSCSPAFVAMFVEALADAGVRDGLPRNTAYAFAMQAVKGSAALMLEKNIMPSSLKDMVTSPGGTTIEGCVVLEEKGMRGAVMDAVHATVEKSKKL